MRQRFRNQISLGCVPINEVQINTKSRHQSVPTLIALQYVFTQEELRDKIFKILEADIMAGKKRTGRYGMSLWEILVLGMMRYELDVDYDFLIDLANNHEELRGILGVQKSDYTRGYKYEYQTLVDNVSQLKAETIELISEEIVKAGHGIIKKKEVADCLPLSVKVDSFPVSADVHFPTDLNLLWDSLRKCLDIIGLLREGGLYLSEWRQRANWYNKTKSSYRNCAEIHRKKGQDYGRRIKEATEQYLSQAKTVLGKVKNSEKYGAAVLSSGKMGIKGFKLLGNLQYFRGMLEKHIDLVNRRILQGEKIPHCEKVFSVFEPHIEWLDKGKPNRKVDLGHNVLIATDQYHFILYSEVMNGVVDKQRSVAVGLEIEKTYSIDENYEAKSISFDRGFYSGLGKKTLTKVYEQVVMPKPGAKSVEQEQQEKQESYQQARRAHNGVESNIYQLQSHGLDKCRDKGIDGFHRCVAYSVLSYNLHRLGKLLIEIEQQKAQYRANSSPKAA